LWLSIDKINRPSLVRRAIGFVQNYFLTGKASPNNPGIVIVVIIVVTGKAESILHGDGIIAQSY